MVEPVETEWFGFYKPGQAEEVQNLQQSELYQKVYTCRTIVMKTYLFSVYIIDSSFAGLARVACNGKCRQGSLSFTTW